MTSDIDNQRLYRSTLLVLTNRRFLSSEQAAGVREWSLADIDKLRTKDRAGLGTLELLGADRRLAVWHYTIAQGPSALVLGDRFEELKTHHSSASKHEDDDVPEAEEHEAPPNTKALFRLWQFARPHALWMFIAFALSLIATVAEVETAKMIKPLINLLNDYEAKTLPDL